jgi:small subunit ribosomal protein S20
MANIKSQKKRIKTNEKARIRNVAYKSKLRTAIKKVSATVASKDVEASQKALVEAFSIIDRAVVKKIESKGTAARQKSKVQTLVNSLSVKNQ